MKIDLVYLWVDSSDKNWQEKKAQYSVDGYNEEAVDNCRFINNDELKYSLRSVEKFAPWINKIFIVTDNQIPTWLNLNNSKIKIIDHTEIIPKDKLPLFNSCAIESRIPFIPELSEYFLYANDDSFIWDFVQKDFFFDISGKPICRLGKRIRKRKDYNHLYGYTISRAYDIVNIKFNIENFAFFPHHGIDAYRKSLFLNCLEEFKTEFEETLNHRFRKFSDMQRVGVTFYILAKNMGIPKRIKLNFYEKYIKRESLESKCYSLKSTKLDEIMEVKTKLMCINDCRRTTPKDRMIIKEFLETKFPQKSEFEL